MKILLSTLHFHTSLQLSFFLSRDQENGHQWGTQAISQAYIPQVLRSRCKFLPHPLSISTSSPPIYLVNLFLSLYTNSLGTEEHFRWRDQKHDSPQTPPFDYKSRSSLQPRGGRRSGSQVHNYFTNINLSNIWTMYAAIFLNLSWVLSKKLYLRRRSPMLKFNFPIFEIEDNFRDKCSPIIIFLKYGD